MADYKVVVVPFHGSKGAMDATAMEKAMNEHGAKGWRVVAVTEGNVSFGFGGGKGEGVAITFEK